MKNIANAVLVGIFFIILWIPMMHINSGEKSEIENRPLAVMPHLFIDGKINNKFGEEFNRWFSDRFLGRDVLVHRYNSFVQGMNIGGNTHPQVLVGKEDWLFYKGDNSVVNFTNSRIPDADKMRQGLAYLRAIDDWCRAHHKKFYYVIAPDKNKIYPEYYPDYIRKYQPDSHGMGMTFYRYIRENSDINVIYPYDALMAAKGDRVLYYTADTHWNSYGAFIAFQEIYRAMFGRAWAEAKFIRRWDKLKHGGDLLDMLSPSNRELYMKNSFFSPVFYKEISCKSEKKYGLDNGYIECHNPSGRGRAFVLRDSFSTALYPFLAREFKTTSLHWRYNLDAADLAEIAKNYDVVILENVERYVLAIFGQQFPKD